MILELLKELFPEAEINEATRMGEAFFSLPIENKWIHFPLDTISEREKKLIMQIAAPETLQTKRRKNRWSEFLLNHSKQVPANFEKVQLMQAMIKNSSKDEFDEQLWLDAFKNTLPFVEDGFFITDQYAVLVIHNPDYIELTEEIDGILNVLDDDFTVQTTVYLGQNWLLNQDLPVLFSEEQQIFIDSFKTGKRNKITTLPQIALPHFSHQSASKSPLLHTLKNNIRQLEGGTDLVHAMWDNLGNVSKAATDLYVHRNTLQYRIDRFFEATGLSLKNGNDLLLSYLAVLSRFEDSYEK